MFNRKIQKIRTAFSMLELVFVIVVLGIVSSIGAEIIADVYGSNIIQRAQYRSSIKVENTLTQIANRLTYAIPGTVIRRTVKGGVPELITDYTAATDYRVLQWVAKDADSFDAISAEDDRLPGWSGFCDIEKYTPPSMTNIFSPGSKLSLANTIIGELSNSTKTIADASLFFHGDTTAHDINGIVGEDEITLSVNPSGRIVEHYKLAWTSYALVVEDDDDGDGRNDLYLYHNFAPIPATAITGTKTLLLRNVTNFKFRGDGRTIRIKFCVNEQIGEDTYIPSCSERVIF